MNDAVDTLSALANMIGASGDDIRKANQLFEQVTSSGLSALSSGAEDSIPDRIAPLLIDIDQKVSILFGSIWMAHGLHVD